MALFKPRINERKYYVQFFISVDILHMGTNANHIGDMNCYSAFFNLF